MDNNILTRCDDFEDLQFEQRDEMPSSVALTFNPSTEKRKAMPIAVINTVRSTAEASREHPSIETTERYWLASPASNFAGRSEAMRPYSVQAISEQTETSRSAIAVHNLAHCIRQDFIEASRKTARFFGNQVFIESLPRLRSKLPIWFRDGNQALAEFTRLPSNWDGDGAESPNFVSREWTRVVLEILLELNFAPTSVTPSVENGVGISFIKGEKYADIECFNTGEILAVASYGQENPPVWEVACDREAIKSALERIQLFLYSESTPENVQSRATR